MYLNHFGLQEAPFGLTPNTGFYYGLPPHEEALQVLNWALAQGEGFIKVTGEVGTGKTLLCRKLLSELGSEERPVRLAWLPNPHLNPAELRIALALELGLAVRDQSELDLTDRIHRHLIALHQQGSRVVVLIDEAQALPDETLEAIRLFGNLETESSKLLQIVLFGQPELDARLAKPHLRQLRQRIGFSYCLRPLRFDETRAYLEHRLQISGYRGAPLFGGRALRQLWRASRGIPRLINILAQKCLMLAYGQGARQIDSRLVRLAVRDTDDARRFVARRWWPLVLLLGCALAYGVWQ
ncbi:MSHA fimbrial biogenesis protein MshM [Aeromonas hydrophila]|uniref:MSHA fimbrial biogenesis protein MshM n=1 Tax=Aeromonas hydrophila TaxID=644 RepID=UPI000C342560|nr:MSHA fimbrial biogenesis protein MshM [Aeromonas hydrophila]ELB2792256.1 MSHA fimbrial biogenesis protein MshM [Aeromonas hydrophila]MCO4206937.1 MSHA fimbrial biogenesis protein MshM [Aeromonas hydrophila]MCO4211064.1 MSHA fimbrial biogenesis protein MshM [Aeromonas hydrophila]MCZ4333759.1 MSHA fimbrial biogenesis protein MshM [Aeromonas hydrophila]PKD22628.1 MSHA biogenesis protein MshM [Aeromonas hydrophila]